MPAAKKSAARTPTTRSRAGTPTARSGSRTPPSGATATRREAERQIARFEKHLDDASEALPATGQGSGPRRPRCLQGREQGDAGTTPRREKDEPQRAQGLRQASCRRYPDPFNTTLVNPGRSAFRRYEQRHPVKPLNKRDSRPQLSFNGTAHGGLWRTKVTADNWTGRTPPGGRVALPTAWLVGNNEKS
jgi:hypothetical protein